MDLDFGKEIVLENNRALMRPLVSADFEHLLPIAMSDKGLLRYSPFMISTPELLREYIDRVLMGRRNSGFYPFIIFDKKHNAYAGSTAFLNISNPDKRLEIGATWIGPQFQRSGLNRNCKFLLMSYAFDDLCFERVELKTDERNLQSRTAIQKIGGQFEGILRSHTLMSDGFRRNTVYYSIIADEWPAVKQKLGENLD